MALYTNKHDHSTAVAEEGHIVISVYTAPSSGVWLVCNTGNAGTDVMHPASNTSALLTKQIHQAYYTVCV